MKFRYSTVFGVTDSRGKAVKRPMLELELIGVDNKKLNAQCSESEIKVPAWFVESENVNILLGQEVFFDRFRIKFEKDHDTFEITESKK